MTAFYRAYKKYLDSFTRQQIVFGILRLLLFWSGYVLLASVDWKIAIGVLCIQLQHTILEAETEWYKSD